MHLTEIKPTDFVAQQQVTPEFGVFFHGTGRKSVYATYHQIDAQGIIGVGEFVTPESVLKMVNSALSDTLSNRDTSQCDFIPEHVLVDTPTRTVWYRRAQARTLLFKFGERQEQIQAQIPALLFIRDLHNLRIFALNSNNRPSLQSPLFHAPLMNINQSGNLCLGDARLPSVIASDEDTLHATEQCFFDCYSGHINHSHTLATTDNEKVTTHQLFEYFVTQQNAQAPCFNTADLHPTHKTLEDII